MTRTEPGDGVIPAASGCVVAVPHSGLRQARFPLHFVAADRAADQVASNTLTTAVSLGASYGLLRCRKDLSAFLTGYG